MKKKEKEKIKWIGRGYYSESRPTKKDVKMFFGLIICLIGLAFCFVSWIGLLIIFIGIWLIYWGFSK
jgi:hypothetical protein